MTDARQSRTTDRPVSPAENADPQSTPIARRAFVGGMFGAGAVVVATPADSQRQAEPARGAALVSILDFIPADLHEAILAAKDRTDVTAHVQRAFDSGARLWAPAEARFHVTTLTIAGLGRFFDLNNALFVGIATTPTPAVVELKCGHSEIRGLRVAVGYNMTYAAGVRFYTDDVTSRYAGYNRFLGGQVEGALIGLLVGGLPDQRRFLTGRDPSGLAVDAPISETTFTQWNLVNCVRGLHMNQPNGKLTFLNCHLAGECRDWPAQGTPRARSAAIVIDNAGSEAAIIGGSVEQLQEPSGRFVEATDGTLTLADVATETICSSYVAGTGRLGMSRLLNGGLNSSTQPYIQARADCSGSITLDSFRVTFPAANAVTGQNDLVTCVDTFGGRPSAAPGLIVDLANIELREPRWSGGGTELFPLVRGAQMRIRQGRSTRFTSDGTKQLGSVLIDDRGDQLRGLIDRSASSIPAYSARGGGVAGGWTVASPPGGGWGRVDAGKGRSALRLTSADASAPVLITSAAFPIDRDRLFVFRAAFQFVTAVRFGAVVEWLDFTGRPAGTSDLFEGPVARQTFAEAQWLSFQAEPPAKAERAILRIQAAGGTVVIRDPQAS